MYEKDYFAKRQRALDSFLTNFDHFLEEVVVHSSLSDGRSVQEEGDEDGSEMDERGENSDEEIESLVRKS